jgi:hypothetical protein
VRPGYLNLTALRKCGGNTESCGSERLVECAAGTEEPDENGSTASGEENGIGLDLRARPIYCHTEPFQRNFSQGVFFSPERVTLDLPSVP